MPSMSFVATTPFDRTPGVPRWLVVTAVPIILFLATIAGAVAFFAGSGALSLAVGQPRRATLPTAGDRFFAFANTAPSTPVAVRASTPDTLLAPITTDRPGNWVRIPALGVTVPLALSPSLRDTDVLTTLSSGVALYPNGVRPGQPGTVFISGHSTGEPWKGRYRFAFLRLSELKPGDVVLVDYGGVRYTYRVTGHRTIDPRKVPTLDSSGPKPTISLMACWPLWSTRSRLLQNGELIAQNPLLLRPPAGSGET